MSFTDIVAALRAFPPPSMPAAPLAPPGWPEALVRYLMTSVGSFYGPGARIYETAALAQAQSVDDGVTWILTLGRTALFDQGGAHYTRIDDAAPLPLGGIQTGDGKRWAMAERTLLPQQFGAVGDGVADDHAAITDAIAASVALKVPLWVTKMHGLSAPLAIGQSQQAVRILGNRGFSELASGACGFRKLAGFAGDAAVMVGTEASTAQNIGFEMEGVEIDGNGQAGDGVQLFRAGDVKLKNVYSHENLTGYGFRFDGCWFGRFENLISRRNGKSSTSQGGAYRFSHATRESSDCEARECYGNMIGNVVLDFDARDDVNANLRQTDWRFYGGEYAAHTFGAGYNDDAPANFNCRLNGDRLVFFGTKFISGLSSDGVTYTSGADKLMLIGTADAAFATKKVFFFGCTFQFGGASRPVADPAGFGVEFAGPVEDIDFHSPLLEGIAPFLDTNGAAENSGPIHISGGDPDTTLYRDGINKLIRNVPGGRVGLGYGAAQDQFYLTSRLPGVPVNIQQTNAGGAVGTIKLGSGVGENLLDLQTFHLRTPARTAAPANPQEGTFAVADRVNWDPAAVGSGGPYLVWYNGAAWVRIHEQ